MTSGDDPRFSARAVRAAYDTVAADYAAAFADDLARLPLDRAMLDAVVEQLPSGGLVLDLGCGPASVAACLRRKGVGVVGADLSAGMLAAARTRNPTLALAQVDMRHLPFRRGSVVAVVAYYSIQHLPRDDLDAALQEMARVLAPNGVLLAATHLGDGVVFLQEFLGYRIDAVGGCLYRRDELAARLDAAGFRLELERRRGPLVHEADTQRIYLLGRRRSP